MTDPAIVSRNGLLTFTEKLARDRALWGKLEALPEIVVGLTTITTWHLSVVVAPPLSVTVSLKASVTLLD